jgi:hypothetical protein
MSIRVSLPLEELPEKKMLLWVLMDLLSVAKNTTLVEFVSVNGEVLSKLMQPMEVLLSFLLMRLLTLFVDMLVLLKTMEYVLLLNLRLFLMELTLSKSAKEFPVSFGLVSRNRWKLTESSKKVALSNLTWSLLVLNTLEPLPPVKKSLRLP